MRVDLEEAARLLDIGEIVGVPTETVYGLAARLDRPAAMAKIFAAKGRPQNNPLIIHVADSAQVKNFTLSFPPGTEELAKAFWPGPLTLILPIREEFVPAVARAGLPTAGFRVPDHPLALALLQKTGPLVMPSANKSGRPSATQPEHVENDFGIVFPVLDGGPSQCGLESTILLYDQSKWVVVRQGQFTAAAFKSVLGSIPEIKGIQADETPLCPGQLYRHYAPKARLSIAPVFGEEEVILGFVGRNYGCREIILLGELSRPDHVAQNLYHALREIDLKNYKSAWVDTHFPREGLWLTILERLEKASQGRS